MIRGKGREKDKNKADRTIPIKYNENTKENFTSRCFTQHDQRRMLMVSHTWVVLSVVYSVVGHRHEGA